MAEAARAEAAGASARRAPVTGPSEVRAVAQEFNRMVEIRRSSEDELRQLAERARELAQKLAGVEQVERRRINAELHDRIGQNLALLNLNLDVAAAQLPPGSPAEVTARLMQARTLLQATIGHVRNVMADLRPPALDEYGLNAALRAHVGAFRVSTGIEVDYQGEDVLPRPSLATETALFRIAQEALTNAAKHARPSHVIVRLSDRSGRLTLCIEDDGAGFDATAAAGERASWGVATMRERAEAIDAALRIDSQPGLGTRVLVEVEVEVER
jgi:two-component system sensor histidine kinase UhpB